MSDQHIQASIDLRAASKIVWDKYFELRRCEDRETPAEVQAIQDLACRLQGQAEALSSHLIRASLARMGIEDMTVTGVLFYSDDERIPNGIRFRDGREAGRIEMLLSDLCGLRYNGLAERLGVEPKGLSFRVQVEKDGETIGSIDSSGRFQYRAASSLRVVIGWMIATDGGRERVIETFNLDHAAQALIDAVRLHGVGKEAFFGAYFNALKEVFVRDYTSRCGDGYCGVAPLLWRIVTRKLGEEHPGYEFCY